MRDHVYSIYFLLLIACMICLRDHVYSTFYTDLHCRIIFSNRIKTLKGQGIVHKLYIVSDCLYVFGPLHCGKSRERYKDGQYPDNMEKLTISNAGKITAEVSFFFREDSNGTTYLLDPATMTLPAGESQVIVKHDTLMSPIMANGVYLHYLWYTFLCADTDCVGISTEVLIVSRCHSMLREAQPRSRRSANHLHGSRTRDQDRQKAAGLQESLTAQVCIKNHFAV